MTGCAPVSSFSRLSVGALVLTYACRKAYHNKIGNDKIFVMKKIALVLVLVGCYPVDVDDWRLAPGVSHLVAAAADDQAWTVPGGVTVWAERWDSECLQAHEDQHKRQARRLNVATTTGQWITGELEAEAVATQDCCEWNRDAWDAGLCWNGGPDYSSSSATASITSR